MSAPSVSILLVDDEPNMLELFACYLTDSGYKTYEARNAQEALIKFQQYQPDMIFMDVNMPGVSGIALLQAIRRQNQVVGILMISGMPLSGLKADVLSLGADGYCQKPVRLEKVNSEILRLQELVTARRQIKAA